MPAPAADLWPDRLDALMRRLGPDLWIAILAVVVAGVLLVLKFLEVL